MCFFFNLTICLSSNPTGKHTMAAEDRPPHGPCARDGACGCTACVQQTELEDTANQLRNLRLYIHQISAERDREEQEAGAPAERAPSKLAPADRPSTGSAPTGSAPAERATSERATAERATAADTRSLGEAAASQRRLGVAGCGRAGWQQTILRSFWEHPTHVNVHTCRW